MQIKKLTIDTEKWARGRINGSSRLHNRLGNMCCLGFLGEACGVETHVLKHRAMPTDLEEEYFTKFPVLDFSSTFIKDRYNYREFASINDREDITDEKRKEILAQMFQARLGIELSFI